VRKPLPFESQRRQKSIGKLEEPNKANQQNRNERAKDGKDSETIRSSLKGKVVTRALGNQTNLHCRQHQRDIYSRRGDGSEIVAEPVRLIGELITA
jgi:hypothetical protein